MQRRWLILIPVALLVWGVLAERVALMLLAVIAYFVIARQLRQGPIGKLASVPDAYDGRGRGNLPLSGMEAAAATFTPSTEVPGGNC